MSGTHNEQARESMRKLHERRVKMGICIRCSGLIDDPRYNTCARCRAEKREINARYRAEKKALKEQREAPAKTISEKQPIPEGHKCLWCVWGRFLEDRFFCPFPVGVCVKEEKHEG